MYAKKAIKILLFLVLVLCLEACGNDSTQKEAKYVTDIDFKIVNELQGQRCDFGMIGTPGSIYCIDSCIVLKDNRAEKNVSIYRKSDHKLTNNLITIGRGANEFLLCWVIQQLDSLVYAFDLQLSRVLAYRTNDFLTLGNPAPVEITTFQKNHPTFALKMNDGRFACTTIDRSGEIITFFNPDGSVDSTAHHPTYPFATPIKASVNLQKRIYYCNLEYSSKNDKLIIYYNLNNIIEIYNPNGELHKRIITPTDYIVPTNNMNNDMLNIDFENVRFTFKACSATDNEIFMLYDGKQTKDRAANQYNSEIYVFDYDGNPKRKLVLDRYVTNICVDDSAGIMYALAQIEGATEIFKYTISRPSH